MSRLRLFVYAVIAMVAAVVVVGLYVAGSPGTQREQRFDDQRVGDLQSIASAVDSLYMRNGSLPATTAELQGDRRNVYYVSSLADPVTAVPYEYRVTGESTYALCATFERPSETLETEPGYSKPMPMSPRYAYVDRVWEHPAGDFCFDLDAKDSLPLQACGLRNPCPAGNTCATVPGEEGALCIPEGKECAAAGCPGDCVILESYPAQVRCNAEVPGPGTPADDCVLMRHKGTGSVGCFGCTDTVCKDPPPNWEPYSRPEGSIGIPYACYEGPSGCELAQ